MDRQRRVLGYGVVFPEDLGLISALDLRFGDYNVREGLGLRLGFGLVVKILRNTNGGV